MRDERKEEYGFQKKSQEKIYKIREDAVLEVMEELQMQRKKGFIFSEKLDAICNEQWGVPAEARGKTEAVLTCLRARFKRVAQRVEKAIRSVSAPAALDSWIRYLPITRRIRRSGEMTLVKRQKPPCEFCEKHTQFSVENPSCLC